MRFRLYDNSGPKDANGHAVPGLLLYDSGLFSIQDYTPDHTGFNTVMVQGLNLRNIPDSVTWTVQFVGLPEAASGGLSLYGPPLKGQSFRDFWEKQEGVWVTKRFSDSIGALADSCFQASAVSGVGQPNIILSPGQLWAVNVFVQPPQVPPIRAQAQAGFDPSRDGRFHRLTLDVNSTAGGQIAVAPYASSQYPEGTSVTLAPNPAPGWTFGSWSGDFMGTNSSTTVIMDADKHLIANFVPPPPPFARIRLAGDSVVIEWIGSGVLQFAPTITGPWSDIYSDASPYETNNATAMSFYRLRSGN